MLLMYFRFTIRLECLYGRQSREEHVLHNETANEGLKLRLFFRRGKVMHTDPTTGQTKLWNLILNNSTVDIIVSC